MPGPRLTFAIPFYKDIALLRRAIDSVCRQRDPEWELLVSDDASQERDTADLVRSYGDRRFRYVRQPGNLGMAGNWNYCLDAAGTELVTILHADDELEPTYVALMRAAAPSYPHALGLFCRTRIIDGNSRPRFSFPDAYKDWLMPPGNDAFALKGEPALRRLLRGNFIMCPTLCYRRDRLGARRFNPRWRMVQDLDFVTQRLLEGETLIGLRAIGYAYRRHTANATAKYTENLLRFEEESQLYDMLREQAAVRGWMAAARLAGEKRIIKFNLAYTAMIDLYRADWAHAREKLRYLRRLFRQQNLTTRTGNFSALRSSRVPNQPSSVLAGLK